MAEPIYVLFCAQCGAKVYPIPLVMQGMVHDLYNEETEFPTKCPYCHEFFYGLRDKPTFDGSVQVVKRGFAVDRTEEREFPPFADPDNPIVFDAQDLRFLRAMRVAIV
jgi:hypothetical protein